jgi:ribosomal protein L19E
MTPSDSHEQFNQPNVSSEVLAWIKEGFLKMDSENGISRNRCQILFNNKLKKVYISPHRR